MKPLLCALSLLALSVPVAASAQDRGDDAVSIALPGITFTRSLNGAAAGAKVESGKLTITSEAKRDNFADPGGDPPNNSAPMLLAEVDNAKPFTLTAKVTPQLLETYDAGTLYVWARADLWLKMAFEMDERRLSRLVTVRTIGTSDDNNHDAVTATSVHMKISSDAKKIGFYYSVDGQSWQLIRLFRNDYPARLWLGASSQSPMGAGNATVFEDVTLTGTSVSDFRRGI